MILETRRAKLIFEIMKYKKHNNGITLKDLYKLIKEHSHFEVSYKNINKNNKKQYEASTRRLLQERAPFAKSYKGKHKDFYRVSYGKWTYYDNPKFHSQVAAVEEINKKLKPLELDNDLNNEERSSLVKTRINQTKFRNNLIIELNEIRKGSPIKNINKEDLLIASHIVDYSDCIDQWEKGNYNNGLILSPDIDKLFDKKYISFSSKDGSLILSKNNKIEKESLLKMGLEKKSSLPKAFLTELRQEFLKKRNKKYGFIS